MFLRDFILAAQKQIIPMWGFTAPNCEHKGWVFFLWIFVFVFNCFRVGGCVCASAIVCKCNAYVWGCEDACHKFRLSAKTPMKIISLLVQLWPGLWRVTHGASQHSEKYSHSCVICFLRNRSARTLPKAYPDLSVKHTYLLLYRFRNLFATVAVLYFHQTFGSPQLLLRCIF